MVEEDIYIYIYLLLRDSCFYELSFQCSKDLIDYSTDDISNIFLEELTPQQTF